MNHFYTSTFQNYAFSWWLYIQRNWFKGLLIFIFLYLYFTKDISISFGMVDRDYPQMQQLQQAGAATTTSLLNPPSNTSLLAGGGSRSGNKKKDQPKWESRKANNFYNITFILSPDYGQRKNIDPAIVEEKIYNCYNYVKRFSGIAVSEMKRTGIPASITLAQGLLESDAGHSRLAVESNNHFGIKCRSKCKGCTCRNYTDDDIYDMFRVFDSVRESYREHSKLLDITRYRHLKKLGTKNYKAWAHGLRKAGYATDKRYAHKLIKIIEEMRLYEYDR